jgi:chromosome segregation ATPase
MAKTRQSAAILDKIEKAQEKVVRSKERYDAAVTELKQLMDKKDAMMKGALMDAFTRSNKTYDEILEFLGTA